MVQKVTGFKTEDGKVFDTEALALQHEKSLSLGAAVKAALIALGGEGYSLSKEGVTSIALQDFLLLNSEVLVDALTPPKKERKPRTPKDPVAPSKPLTEALETVATTASVAPVVETAPVNTAAADKADDELAALLGGAASTAAEVAV